MNSTFPKFPFLHPDEQVRMVMRAHWWIFVKIVAAFVIQLALGIGVVVLFFVGGVDFETEGLPQILLVLFGALYFLFCWILFLYHWVDYYLDIWVVTDQRVLNIVQHGLFSRTISELSIQNIQDVTAEIHGKIATVLDFGDVHIQTAGERKRFMFNDVGDPESIASQITEIQRNAKIPAHS